ncbi:MAG: cbb3-type cytochrome c oxidase subunit 3 [Bacteroidales bacterium]
MRIITDSFDSAWGLEIIGSGLLVAFFILFLWIIYRLIRTNKKDAESWANLPLEDDKTASEREFNNNLQNNI